jgi:hypothetical protein
MQPRKVTIRILLFPSIQAFAPSVACNIVKNTVIGYKESISIYNKAHQDGFSASDIYKAA